MNASGVPAALPIVDRIRARLSAAAKVPQVAVATLESTAGSVAAEVVAALAAPAVMEAVARIRSADAPARAHVTVDDETLIVDRNPGRDAVSVYLPLDTSALATAAEAIVDRRADLAALCIELASGNLAPPAARGMLSSLAVLTAATPAAAALPAPRGSLALLQEQLPDLKAVAVRGAAAVDDVTHLAVALEFATPADWMSQWHAERHEICWGPRNAFSCAWPPVCQALTSPFRELFGDPVWRAVFEHALVTMLHARTLVRGADALDVEQAAGFQWRGTDMRLHLSAAADTLTLQISGVSVLPETFRGVSREPGGPLERCSDHVLRCSPCLRATVSSDEVPLNLRLALAAELSGGLGPEVGRQLAADAQASGLPPVVVDFGFASFQYRTDLSAPIITLTFDTRALIPAPTPSSEEAP